MSRMKLSSDRKPPLAESMSQLRSRSRLLRSNTTSIVQTSPVSLMKTQPRRRSISSLQESELRPEYQSITYEFHELEKMVKDEFGNYDLGNPIFAKCFSVTPLERGRYYDEYSARRNERLRRKRGEIVEEKKSVYNLGVNVESGKKSSRGGESKKLESLRKSVPANFTITRSENTRYSLRSSTKENKKPPLIPNSSSLNDGEYKLVTRRIRNI